MTLYWWMHWFWITVFLSMIRCKESPTTLPHSSWTAHASSSVYNLKKAIGNAQNPPQSMHPAYTKNVTTQNITLIKFTKPSLKKVDLHFSTSLTMNETVINQISTTEINNVTDNQVLNSNLSAINYTNNLTYREEEISNQSLSHNSQSMEVDKEDVNVSEGNLSVAGITGITLGCVVVVGMICGISFFLYRARGFNRPQVLNDRCSNPDSSGYIDDASVRDNSEEMYSLDNDSFLNSLEAMTIQNYWTDTVKHTKL